MAAFTAGILGYAVLASTTRYMADDYWTAYIVKTTPFWQLPAYWYTHWSGRFSFFFLVSLAELAGVRIVPILPFLALLSLTCATTLLAWRWLRVLQLQHPLPTAFLTATLFVYCTIHSTPNVLQSLYWQTGMLTYFAPIGLFVAYLALVSRLAQCRLRGWRWLWLAISGLLVFVIGGFSETSIAIQVTALSLGLAVCAFLFGRRHWLPWLGVGLAASLLAMVVMILAPGNQIRLAGNTPHLDVGYVFTTSLKVGLGSLLGALRTYPLDALIAFCIPASAAYFLTPPVANDMHRRMVRLAMIAVTAITMAVIILVVAGNTPAYYVMHSGPPIRTEVIQQAILTAGLIAVGTAAGLAIRYGTPLARLNQGWIANAAVIGVVILLVLGPGRFLTKAATQYPILLGYAAQWEARDRQLNQAASEGQKSITVKEIDQLDRSLGDLRSQPDFWINQKAADYYGLQSISAK